MQFAMASALVARKVGLVELTDSFVRNRDVQAIFPRVSITATDAAMEGSAFAPADSVEITTKSGETHKSGPVEYAKGSHQQPLSQEELFGKFADCVDASFQGAKKSRTFEKLMMFDRLNRVGDLALQD